MDIRNYLSNSRKRSHKEVDSDSDSTSDNESVMPDPRCTQPVQLVQSKSDKKKAYKSKLTYRQQWKLKYSWIDCANAEMGMFCVICKKYGKPPGNARGAWTTRGITDWNHATEMLKLHNDSKWHKDAAITAQMAQQSDLSVLELQNAASARDTKERKKKNQAIILKLLRSIYFLVKHRIPHTTTFNDLLALQVANGDEQLAHHLEQSPGNAMYTSKFSLTSL